MTSMLHSPTLSLLTGMVAVILVASACSQPSSFQGTVLESADQAPSFQLRDQFGNRVSSGDFTGKVVVLTFLYTSCTDVCPFIAAKFKSAIQLLGEDAERVEFVAISSDPERDTVERVAEYSRKFGMYDQWHYLTGSKERLKPVWDAYYVGEPVITSEAAEEISEEDLEFYGLLRGLDDASIAQAKEIIKEFGGGYDVGHGIPVWLIDPKGRMRVKLGQDLAPSELVHDIRLLL